MQGPAALSKAASTKESQPSPTPSLTVARGNRVFEGILRGQRTVGNRVLASALGSATTPLDSHLRHRFERAFGVDLGTVRLHLGPAASTAARLLRAEAVTSGDDILFGGGKYEPSTQAGRQLLAHELAHVAQTRIAGRAVGQGPDYAEHERSAEAAAAAWKDGTLATGTINSLRSVALGTGAPAPMILRKADENQAEDYARAMALEMLDVDPASTSTDLLLHEARLLQGDAVAQGDRLPRSATAASHRLIELYGELSRRAVAAPHDQEGALLMPDQFGDLKPWTPRRPTRLEEVPPFSAENLSLWLTIESAAEPTAHPPSRQQARRPKPRPVPAEAAIVITSALQRREGTTRDKVTETTDAIVKYVTDLVRREFHLPARPSGPKEGAKPSSIAGGIALLRATSESEMLEQLAKSSTANLRAQDPRSSGAKAGLDPKGGQTSLLDAAGQLYFVAEQVYAIDHYGNITPGENVHQYSNTNLAPGTYFVSPIYLSGAPHVVVMRIDSGVQIVSNPVLLASTVLWDWIPMVTSGQQVLKAGLGVAFIVGSDRSAPAVAKWENLDRVMARVPEEIPWAIGQAVLSLLEKYMLQNLGETIATEAIHRGLAELAEMIPELKAGIAIYDAAQLAKWLGITLKTAIYGRTEDEQRIAAQAIALKIAETVLGKLEGKLKAAVEHGATSLVVKAASVARSSSTGAPAPVPSEAPPETGEGERKPPPTAPAGPSPVPPPASEEKPAGTQGIGAPTQKRTPTAPPTIPVEPVKPAEGPPPATAANPKPAESVAAPLPVPAATPSPQAITPPATPPAAQPPTSAVDQPALGSKPATAAAPPTAPAAVAPPPAKLSEPPPTATSPSPSQATPPQRPGGGATESAILQREDPEAKKAREGNIEAGAAIIKRAQSQPGVKLPDPATEVLGPEIHPGPSDLPDYQSGKTPLRPGDIDRLAAYNTRHRRGDPFEGHEVSQNAWLVLKGLIGKRNKGPISRGNPSLALTEEEHLRVGKEQGKLGLNDQAQLAKMSPTEMLKKNIEALENAGIERSRIETIRREAEAALGKATGTTITTRPTP